MRRSLWWVSFLGFGDPPASLDSCSTGFRAVESLSDLIDGDPPESMRLGKRDSPLSLESQGGHQREEAG